ncbi:unnamed protein product [Tetraodon nigroviridis]|uniref:(spotted green pufferfish) hypothetical protein n=1 Tax=Tetraodon nigroviridis TaxID=99883 RepID=Q4TFG9_TETNG|nr:unnamed protein product [Tetraodon nigroviridis]
MLADEALEAVSVQSRWRSSRLSSLETRACQTRRVHTAEAEVQTLSTAETGSQTEAGNRQRTPPAGGRGPGPGGPEGLPGAGGGPAGQAAAQEQQESRLRRVPGELERPQPSGLAPPLPAAPRRGAEEPPGDQGVLELHGGGAGLRLRTDRRRRLEHGGGPRLHLEPAESEAAARTGRGGDRRARGRQRAQLPPHTRRPAGRYRRSQGWRHLGPLSHLCVFVCVCVCVRACRRPVQRQGGGVGHRSHRRARVGSDGDLG